MDFDLTLIQRYDQAGPRYTSYPTARQFASGFDPGRYLEEVARSNDDLVPPPLSVYVHLPFCANPCYYCGCTRVINRDPEKAARYLQRLLHEADLQGRLFDRDREVRQLHLGGGTPTSFNDGQLALLLQALRASFSFNAGVEASIEIDPRTVTASRLLALAEMGFDRVSFGIQDLDGAVQEAVNRVQERQHCLEMIAVARECFDSVAVDLIYGLPRQSPAGFGETLEAMIAARPGRIAIYGYAHLPSQFKAQRQIEAAELPGPARRLELLALAVQKLTAAGYEYIGIDHFALPEDSLAQARRQGTLQRNFQGYSTLAGLDLVGLGMSAIGHVGRVYVQNAKTLDAYYGALDAGCLPTVAGLVMSEDDVIRADVINRLMCYDQVRFADIEELHHINFRSYFARELDGLKGPALDGLVTLTQHDIRVSPAGRYVIRALAMHFDAYLPGRPAAGAATEPSPFSRVV